MRYFADLHVHSRFARATSKSLNLLVLDEWASKKGLQLLGTGDFTHPYWFGELKDQLEPAPEKGFYTLKTADMDTTTRFVPSVEISSIYSEGGKTRRVHTLVIMPSLEAVADFNKQLSYEGNLRSDGRPILGTSAENIARLALKVHHEALVIPAHAWTPWFSVFGSMSGFDSLEECFKDLTPQILAIETGLSSDPPMNWRLSKLDDVALISNSDAHSANKLGREATEFEGDFSYAGLRQGLRTGAPARAKERDKSFTKLIGTVEFYPEEGKYHYDGHRNCKIRWTPAERKKHKGICPVCGRAVTVGVLSRVDELADRPDTQPKGAPGFRSLVPLEELIAESLGINTGTKGVNQHYEYLLKQFGNEYRILIDTEPAQIGSASLPIIGAAIERMRVGKLHIDPGYDGEFGTVKIFEEHERSSLASSSDPQSALF